MINSGESTVVAFIGDTTKIGPEFLHAQEIIEDVTRIQEPYKHCSRKAQHEDTDVTVGGSGSNAAKIGGSNFCIDLEAPSPEVLPGQLDDLGDIVESLEVLGVYRELRRLAAQAKGANMYLSDRKSTWSPLVGADSPLVGADSPPDRP